jgi:hypothetical protein
MVCSLTALILLLNFDYLLKEMKKVFLFTVFCTLIFVSAKAFWSRQYWYKPVSNGKAELYFQVRLEEPEDKLATVYVWR